MKDEIRLFVAVTLPAQLKAFLQEQMQGFKHPSIRQVPEQNLHLTLFFIGNTQATNLVSIEAAIQQIAATHEAFDLQYLCTEPGPNLRSPRLVWARFEQQPAFEKLSHALAQELAPNQKTKQKPIPHVTVARFKKDSPAPTFKPLPKPDAGINLTVDSVSLWQSELASPHPIYSVLKTYPLAAKP